MRDLPHPSFIARAQRRAKPLLFGLSSRTPRPGTDEIGWNSALCIVSQQCRDHGVISAKGNAASMARIPPTSAFGGAGHFRIAPTTPGLHADVFLIVERPPRISAPTRESARPGRAALQSSASFRQRYSVCERRETRLHLL